MSRCAEHRQVPPENLNAEQGTAECGACIMEQVAYLHNIVLMDVLDSIALLLRHHAEIRVECERQQAHIQARCDQAKEPTIQ